VTVSIHRSSAPGRGTSRYCTRCGLWVREVSCIAAVTPGRSSGWMSFSKSDSAPSDRPSEKPGVPSAWLNQATRLEAMSQDQTSICPVSRAIETSSGWDSSGRCGSGGEGGALTPGSGVSMERYFRLPRMVSLNFDLVLGRRLRQPPIACRGSASATSISASSTADGSTSEASPR